jgi:hypothetical protein
MNVVRKPIASFPAVTEVRHFRVDEVSPPVSVLAHELALAEVRTFVLGQLP